MSSPKEVLLGRLAVQRGFLSQEDLDVALQTQTDRGGGPALGELLIELGLISRRQLDGLMAQQKDNLQSPSPYTEERTVGEDLLGRRAIEAGLLTQDQLAEGLRLHGLSQRAGEPKRLGEILVERGYLTFDQVWQLLGDQGKRIFRCPECRSKYNVHGIPDAASLKCRKCGTQLAEAPPPVPASPASPEPLPPARTPSAAKPTPSPRKLKADGTWYGKTTADPPPGAAGPRRKATKVTRMTKSVQVDKDVEYLPYDRRVRVSSSRKRWTVFGTLGFLIAVTVLLVFKTRAQDAVVVKAPSAGDTSAGTPSPSATPGPGGTGAEDDRSASAGPPDAPHPVPGAGASEPPTWTASPLPWPRPADAP